MRSAIYYNKRMSKYCMRGNNGAYTNDDFVKVQQTRK